MSHLKILTLISLTFQNSSLILLSRYSLGILNEQYLKQSSILMSEILKLGGALFLGLWNFWWRRSQGEETRKRLSAGNQSPDPSISSYLLSILLSTYVMSPIALIYFLQNYLQYFALHHLAAPIYAVIAQLKILSTAVFFVAFLRDKRIHGYQWRALLYLIVGVILVQYSSASADSQTQTSLIGLASGLTVATLSGLAGVYFEFVLKQSEAHSKFGIWERNAQLSLCSILFSVLSFIPERERIEQHGLLGGFSWVSWMCVFDMALGGLLVGAVIQYADAVLKNFASSIAITLTAIVSVVVFGQSMTWLNWSGIALVCSAVFLYSQPTQKPVENKKQ